MDNPDRKAHGSTFREHLRTIPRHKFLIVIPLVLVFLGSMIVGSTLPKLYTATALFRDIDTNVEGRRRSRNEDDLQVMKAIILSRSNLVEVIKSVGLDASYRDLPEGQQLAREDALVRKLQKNLQIEQRANRVYAISYRDEDPHLVDRVANQVMQNYIDGVVQKETKDLNDNVAFLDKEVQKWQQKVSESSEALKKFKVDNVLNLPGTPLSDIDELVKIIDELSLAEQALLDAQTAKKEIEKQIAELDQEEIVETVVKESPLITDYRRRLIELEQNLAQLKTQLTDAHPQVIEVKKNIETVKSLMEKAANETTTEQKRQANPLYLSLQQELRKAEVEIKKAERKRDLLRARKEACQERVKDSPAQENELTGLTQDYERNQATLAKFTSDLRDAQVEHARETSRGKARFPIQDYARRPTSPERSNRLKVALLGLVVGTGLGLGLAVLKDQMDSSFKNVEDVASFLDIPIVGTIPVIATATERAREKKKETLGWMIVGALVILLGAAFIVITFTSL